MVVKRGVISDAILFTILLFVVSVGLLVVFISYDALDEALSSNDQISNSTAERFSEGAAEFPSTWDFVFLTAFIGVVIGVLVISYLLATQPVFFFVFMFVVVVLGGLAGFIANSFDQIILDLEEGTGLALSSGFPIMNFIMSNYLMFIVVMVMLMLIVFYAKPNQGGFA